MGVNSGFQIRWIVKSAITCAFASSVLLVFLQLFLGRSLGHDYNRAYYTLKDLDSSVLALISTPIVIYILVSSLLVIFFKLFISHKIAGPLFRFERCASSVGLGDFDFSTKLRPGDQLNSVAGTFQELKDFLSVPLGSAESALRNIENLIQEIEQNFDGVPNEAIEGRIEELESELARLAEDLRRETWEKVGT